MVVLDLQFLVGTTKAAFEFSTHACLGMDRRLRWQRIFSFSSLGSTGHRLHDWTWSNGGTTKVRRIRGCRCRCRHHILLPTSKEQQAHTSTSSIVIGRYLELAPPTADATSIFDFAEHEGSLHVEAREPHASCCCAAAAQTTPRSQKKNKRNEEHNESVNHGGDDGANCRRRRAGTP